MILSRANVPLQKTLSSSRKALPTALSSQQQQQQQQQLYSTTKATDKSSNTSSTSILTGSSSSSANSKSSNSSSSTSRPFTSLNCNTPFQLCFLRHGQSTWNRDNRFIGWTDTPLTDDGVLEARVAGQMLTRSGMKFDEVHTSLLRRCIRTTNLVLMEMQQEYIPVHKHWRLNERHYGDLVSKNKKEVVKIFGKDQVRRWRRSWDEPPPPMQDDHKYHPLLDPRYRMLEDKIPKCESLKCTLKRSKIYWEDKIIPSLQAGRTVLIVGHENNLRSLIMNLENIHKDDIINLCLPRAVPLAYRLDSNFQPLDRKDGKLDEATGFLRGEWLGGDEAVKEILDRDRKQVYDTSIEKNLEVGPETDKWRKWMKFAAGSPQPEMKAKSSVSGDFVSGLAGKEQDDDEHDEPQVAGGKL
jgi:2,3-bisphosphoglycerate-dependent phosphoglycerate mutase